ncbi:hypothetical protein PbJCM13498_03850 [Prolixibacter bellariivorans]|uniref:Uncharacterized protein n=2 Tax=Prolixibacter bellariivorans TaxID=314319 RepID=A0A5M4AUC4_9BACT|nr:hypothetical protein [Prolixibacter bellariivorans]GET31522.1 hypothetical protein PbJCM13498_03850 [Prolixibacter bellariivorans]
MRRVTLITLIIFSLTNLSFGQTIQEIFKALPLSYTGELTTEAKDSLIEQGTYTIPGGDSDETMKVDYSAEKDYIRLDYYYTTGQSGFIVIELRRFQKADGSFVVVYSKYGGAERAYDQDSLLTFDYENGTLKQNENLGLPENLKTRAFLKDNLPDSLKEENITLSTSYNLKPKETNGVEYEVDPQSDQFTKWIKTERILFVWNGKRFEKRKE